MTAERRMTKRAKALVKDQRQGTETTIKNLLLQVDALEKERDDLALRCSSLALRETSRVSQRTREATRLRKEAFAVSEERDQQKAIKEFRTGQATVLLATVNMLEKVLAQYADKNSWCASDSVSNPEHLDRFVCSIEQPELGLDEDGNPKIRQIGGWELAQRALQHELLQVG